MRKAIVSIHSSSTKTAGKPKALAHFLREWCVPQPIAKITCAGKNFQGFDKPFLQLAYPDLFNFHHRCFDATTSFYQKGDKQLPDLKLCLERAKITIPFKLHTAVDDAKAVIALLRTIHEDQRYHPKGDQ
jgi:hypothetical protein